VRIDRIYYLCMRAQVHSCVYVCTYVCKYIEKKYVCIVRDDPEIICSICRKWPKFNNALLVVILSYKNRYVENILRHMLK